MSLLQHLPAVDFPVTRQWVLQDHAWDGRLLIRQPHHAPNPDRESDVFAAASEAALFEVFRGLMLAYPSPVLGDTILW